MKTMLPAAVQSNHSLQDATAMPATTTPVRCRNPLCGWRPCLLAWLLLASPLIAQQSRSITVESAGMQPPVVIGRPMLTWWDVKIQGPGLVVGQFHFTVKYDETVLADVETEEITVNGPEQRIRVMLPPLDESTPYDQLKVDISIRGKNLNEKLGEQVLRVPFATKKVFIGLVAEPRLGRKRSSEHQMILEHLKFESLVQDDSRDGGADDNSEAIKTILTSIDTGDLPSDPLAYCGYDLLVFMDEEFRTLRKPQLEAILAWVKAGGSLFVEPKGVLEGYHLEFLRGLVNEDSRGLVLQTDPAGRIPTDTVPSDEIALLVTCGMGHAAIRTDDSEGRLPQAKSAWQPLTSTLWSGRYLARIQPNLTRQRVGPNGQPTIEDAPNPDRFGLKYPFANRIRIPIGDLIERLMPEGVRMVPLSVLASILFTFVILIGPADYYVLGWLRLRKLTWVTFPLATIGITILTIWLSNSYMSAAETRRAVTVRDLDSAGETVRSNRFELLYIASSRRVLSEIDKGVFSSLKTSGMDPLSVAQANYGGNMGGGYQIGTDGQVMTPPPRFEGRIPTQYSASQEVQKWTPQLNRVLTIPGAAESLSVDWDEFDLNATQVQDLQRRELPHHILASAKKQFGANVMVACFHHKEGWAYNRDAGWGAPQTEQMIANRSFRRQMSGFVVPGMMEEPQAPGEVAFFRWIYQVSVAPTNPGLFSVVKQVTPKGGASCDDLPILDSTDPESWLLVIVLPQKDEYSVYRKLMRVKN